jgi:hypothetical protein
VASLLWPQTARYEIAPWPERVFHGRYPSVDKSRRRRGEAIKKDPIPAGYATELLNVMNALNNMDQSIATWDCGTRGIGLVVSDSMMFQRAAPSPSDAHLGSFFGLALPLLERGMPIEPVQLETASIPGNLTGYRVLLMTYEGMKPMTPEANRAIAAWVKDGGILVFVDADLDPYSSIKSWWNSEGKPADGTARLALFEELGLGRETRQGTHRAGRGSVIYDSSSPAALSYQGDGAGHCRKLVHESCQLAGLEYREAGWIILRRGPYLIGAGLESAAPVDRAELHGRFVDLFAPELPILKSVKLQADRRFLLLDLDQFRAKSPRVLAAACRVSEIEVTPNAGLHFVAVGPASTNATMRVLLERIPTKVAVDDQGLTAENCVWDEETRTLLLRFPNCESGRRVRID